MNAPFSPKIELGTIERHPVTTREAWLEMRKRDLTASDVASVAGVGYKSPLAVWGEKKGLIPPTADNAILRRGRWFEPAIWMALKERFPTWELRPAKIYLRSPSLRFGATPDAVAIDPDRDGIVLIQGKVVSKPIWDRDWATDNQFGGEVPLGYQLQTLSETMLAEKAYGQKVHPILSALVVDTFSAELYPIPVERHAEAEQKILATVGKFWSDFDAGRQPLVDPSQDHDTIKSLYPSDNGATIDLTADNSLPILMDQRKVLSDEIKAREDRKKEIETTVKSKLGEASFALIAGGRKLSLKVTKRSSYVVQETSYRSLREVKVR